MAGIPDSQASAPSGQKFKLLNIGFGNLVIAERVVALFNPSSSPMRRLREDAKQQGKLIDATQGRKTRCIVVTDSGHVILSAVQPETIKQRFAQDQNE
ncbi:DUF370 domain-containing protein [Desulfovibrio sp. OttesenSCG-928-C06]|nr:DUF370 domain-containing protein [Desulfovibrio sp. OttesenSCG-928-C06]